MPSIWSDSYLTQLAVDAEQQINQDVPCIFYKFYLPTTKGVSNYTLPAFCKSIIRITWRGYELNPVNFDEFIMLTPATVFVASGSSQNIETSQSRPLYYTMHPTNPYDIRLYPTPNESFGTTGNPYAPQPNEPFCNFSCYSDIDSTFADLTRCLPIYIDRRMRKAYILWKAFSAEGSGQNLTAADYYGQKYKWLVERFREINDGAFIGKYYGLDDRGLLSTDGWRYPRPTLPPNFERIIF